MYLHMGSRFVHAPESARSLTEEAHTDGECHVASVLRLVRFGSCDPRRIRTLIRVSGDGGVMSEVMRTKDQGLPGIDEKCSSKGRILLSILGLVSVPGPLPEAWQWRKASRPSLPPPQITTS